MAAPTECGNCVPTFTLKNLRIKDIDPDHGITFHKLIIEYVVCLKDIKCIPRSTKLPDPKIRLPAFKDRSNECDLSTPSRYYTLKYV